MDKKRVIIAGILFLIMVVAGIYVYKNREKIFNNYVEIGYIIDTQKCVETYRNGILISPSCEYMYPKQTKRQLNFTMPNIGGINASS